MVFTSILFLLVFLPFFLLAYHLAPVSKRNIVALVGSLIFYMWGAPMFFWLLIVLLVGNFYIVRSMDTSLQPKLRKALLVVSLSINLGVLAYFKYANFFVENVNSIFKELGLQPMQWMEVALPIGISFFTFQSITYTLDVYWKKHSLLDRIWDYLLYILLFPQLIAGPIIRFNTIADEIKDRKQNYTTDYKLSGLYIFIIGLAKKVLIANQIGEQVDVIFGHDGDVSRYASWVGIIAYSMQIYFDFAGYSDMAIGLGKMLGFNFPENFKSPYTSKSITEFWRRWHITLGAFMRDYLYIPLGGSRSSSASRVYFNLIVVFLLSGLWHGASWNFVIWGAWHGVFLIIERAFLLRWFKVVPKFIQLAYCYFVVLIGWVFFRADTLPEAMRYLGNMFGVNQGLVPFADLPEFSFYFFLAIAIFFAFITLTRAGKTLENFFFNTKFTAKQYMYLSPMYFVLLILSISYIGASGFNPFIYFRF
ncbi:putative membrane protein involved in D-alanine export [Owenweeksia hongkongensis DSM 17368]|uniref:Putative membrane protein involved in D-alanine export n=2 Tax=Owenweeksia TaxID=267986 RepID=G8R0L3_OWEHD|nr:putative membrane protein involved in D-alanine export [Owenweeksia hongkongensis DSM 17368]